MHEKLKDFMVQLACDADALYRFIADPAKALDAVGLSDEEKSIVLSADQSQLYNALAEPRPPSPPQPAAAQPAAAQPQPAVVWPPQPVPDVSQQQQWGWPTYAAYVLPQQYQPTGWPLLAYAVGVPWVFR